MRRRRSVPWIHRWSRIIISIIAIAGAILTAYLTITKLTGGEVACSVDGGASGCGGVLNSPYAKVFGLPLSLFGCVAYISMAAFALTPLLANTETNKGLRKQLENITWLLLLVGSTAMTVFSGYLMYVLAFKIQSICYYCIGSALFALSMLILTIIGRNWEDIGQIFFTGAIVAILTIVGTLGVYAGIDRPSAIDNPDWAIEVADTDGIIKIPTPPPEVAPKPPKGWEISTTSGESEIDLAKHLTAIGAKKYGAFWCPHCFEQKQLFGKEAFEEVNYIECADLNNPRQQSSACKAANITSYPTWEIKGKFYQGTQTLTELGDLSNYQGTKDFKYKL